MKPEDSTVSDENEDVHSSGKCTVKSIRTVENPSPQNVSSKKKNALLLKVSHDNVDTKKPIFRRKLIEKYSTARYNFNTKRVNSLQPLSKKKAKQSSIVCESVERKKSIFGVDFYNLFRESNSKNNTIHINSAVIPRNSSTDFPAQSSSANTEESFRSDRLNVVGNSNFKDCGVPVPERNESFISCHHEKDENPRAESMLPARNLKSIHKRTVMSDLRASILSRVRLAQSIGALNGSGSSKTLETASSLFSDNEDSDSGESTYLTISYDGDSDSRFSIISNEDSGESYDASKSAKATARRLCSEFNSELAKKIETEKADKSTAHRPNIDSSVTVKNAESCLSLKKCDTNTAGLKLSDSDSDSGLQLGSSDGEKSCSDQLKPEVPKVGFAKLLSKNIEKSHKHLFSFDKTNDWVNYSSQKPSQLEPNSGLNVDALSAQIPLTNRTCEHLSSDSNAVSHDSSVDVASNSANKELSSFGSNKVVKTSEANKNLRITCSEPFTGLENQTSHDSDREELAEEVTATSNCVIPEKSSFVETDIQSHISAENSGQVPVLLKRTLVYDEVAKSEHEKNIEKWKLVPSAFYQHLAENYETQKMDTYMPEMQKKKRKKRTMKKRLGYPRRHVLAKKVPDEPIQIPYRDPYADTLKELEIQEESKDEPLTENIGMILHVGVNRPLFPEIYRNIITLNEKKTDGEITDLWADFALTTLITEKSSKPFKSVFLPVKDTKLKSTIDEYRQKTSCEFQEVDLQKVTSVKPCKKDCADATLAKNLCSVRKRKNADNCDGSSAKLSSRKKFGSSAKRRKTEKSKNRPIYKVDFPTIRISPPSPSPKSKCMSLTNPPTESFEATDEIAEPAVENSIPAVENSIPVVENSIPAVENSIPDVEYSSSTTEKLSDEALLAKHGYKPCCVLLPKISTLPSSTYAEEDEESDNLVHFFGEDHCSRTYGQMLDYRSRNHSLVFFHRLKRILRLQRQNNKLFHSCRYVRLRPDIDDEFEVIDVLHDSAESSIDSKSFTAEVTKNPLDILKTWKLNLFEAPLLKGIDVNANKFPIRFMNHQLLKSEINVKWFILQLNKCMLNVIHRDNDVLPIEQLFQIICRADLTKKVVCNTIGAEFNPDVLNFGVYGVPGLCEAVVLGPYANEETQHDLTALVQLWNGETAIIPILETSFDVNKFFLWNEDSKVRSVYGLWWKPGDVVPCTYAANSAFMNHLFNPAECEPSIERSVKVQSLLKQHPCLTYSKYDRGGLDVNIRLIHQSTKLNYASSGLNVSERIAMQNFVVNDSPLLQPTKLRSRTNMPNYSNMVSPKLVFSEPKSDVKRDQKNLQKLLPPKIPVRHMSTSERLRTNTVNERLRRKEFSVLRSNLRSTVDAKQDASLISILNKAQEVIKIYLKEENNLKSTKRNLFFIRKNLIRKLKADMRKFPNDHLCYRKSIEVILNLGKADRAENFARNPQLEAMVEPKVDEKDDRKDNIVTDSNKPIESDKPVQKKINPIAMSRNLKLKRRHRVGKGVWRKVVESTRLEPPQKTREQSRPQPRPQPSPQSCPQPRQQPCPQPRQQPCPQPRQQPCPQPRQQPCPQPRQQPCPQPRQQPCSPVSESFEICSSLEEVLRSEHSYSKRGIGLRRNGRWSSKDVPSKEQQKLPSNPSSLMVRFSQDATESSNDRDQVAVYLTENDLPVTKLVIQRLKSVNENSRHLSSTERRNQIIALIREIVRKSLSSAHSQDSPSNQEERFLVPRLLLLQRLLEGANMRVRDSSKIRVIDETIEISDDDDQDEFSIESTDNTSCADNVDGQTSKRCVYVKVSSAQPNVSPLQDGIVLTNSPVSVSSSDGRDSQMENDATTIIDDQLSVENQIFLNTQGDEVDLCNYISNTVALQSSKRRRAPSSNPGQRKVTLLKRVNGAVSADGDETPDADPNPISTPPELVDASLPANRGNVSSRGCSRKQPSSQSKVSRNNRMVPRRIRRFKLPNSEVKLLRDMLETPTPTPPRERLYAKKTFSTPNYRKLIAQRRAKKEMMSPTSVSVAESRETHCGSTDVNDLDYDYAAESFDMPEDVTEDAPMSLSDYMRIHPDLLIAKRIPSKKPPFARFKPNILAKSSKAKSSSSSRVVVPLNGKKVSLPAVLDKRFAMKKRIRCPSFVPPSLHRTSSAKTVATKEEPTEMSIFPLEEDTATEFQDDVNEETVDDFGSFEYGSPEDDEPSTSRRSSGDSSTRLAVKSFASVHSFNDNFINNMDRLLKF